MPACFFCALVVNDKHCHKVNGQLQTYWTLENSHESYLQQGQVLSKIAVFS
jgi:hypothetical protein